jgi:hypothetical protein
MTTPDTPEPQPWRFTKAAYVAIGIGWIIYVIASLAAPSTANAHYHISAGTLLLLRIGIFVPVLIIWILAVRGTATIKTYAAAIDSGAEAPALNRIADGLIWTIVYLVSASVVGALVPYFIGTPWIKTAVLIRNHISPLIALIAFILIFRGSQGLKQVSNFVTWSTETIIALGIFAVFSFGFVMEFANSPTTGTDSAGIPLAILSHEAMLFTAVMPFILAWFLGILAMINIRKYATTVNGILYREALRNLAYGVGVIIVFTMFHQILIFASRFLANLNLGFVLLVVYLLLGLYAVGFMLVRRGARNLMRIEALR